MIQYLYNVGTGVITFLCWRQHLKRVLASFGR